MLFTNEELRDLFNMDPRRVTRFSEGRSGRNSNSLNSERSYRDRLQHNPFYLVHPEYQEYVRNRRRHPLRHFFEEDDVAERHPKNEQITKEEIAQMRQADRQKQQEAIHAEEAKRKQENDRRSQSQQREVYDVFGRRVRETPDVFPEKLRTQQSDNLKAVNQMRGDDLKSQSVDSEENASLKQDLQQTQGDASKHQSGSGLSEAEHTKNLELQSRLKIMEEQIKKYSEELSKMHLNLSQKESEISNLKNVVKNSEEKYQNQLNETDLAIKRYKDQVKLAEDFAISKFAKDLLEIRDNLQFAINEASKFDIKNDPDIGN